MKLVFKEIQVYRNRFIRGFIHHPDADVIGTAVIVPGYFSSQKLGPASLYKKIANLFADNGIACLRFDFLGMGESDGDYDSQSIDSKFDCFEKLYNYALQLHENIIVVGHSMGTNLATRFSNRYQINHLLLISPTFGPISNLSNLFRSFEYAILQSNGYIMRKGLIISKKIMNYAQNEEIAFLIENSTSKFYVILAEKDELFTYSDILKYINKINVLIDVYTIKEADHNFIYKNTQGFLLSRLNYIIKDNFVKNTYNN